MKREDLAEARRLATEHLEPWSQIGTDIMSGGRFVGSMKTPELARYVIAMHRVFIPLLNTLLRALRRAKDVENLEEI